MEKFCEFSVHEYMDMYPHSEVRTFKGKDEEEIKANAVAWAKEMTQAYSGGPTSFVKIMSRADAADYLCKIYKECLMDSCWPDEENIDSALHVTSEKNIKLFFDCYGRNSNK